MRQLKTHRKFIAICLLVTILCNSSCSKKNDNTQVVTPKSSTGKLTIKMSNVVNDQPITLGTMSYTNAVGSVYRIDLLKYYITNFTLVNADHTERNFANYKLINAADTSSCSFSFDSVANGNYTSVRFYLGVDSARNHTGAQDGDLDPQYGMIWAWNTGYMFFKHEGAYKNDSGTTTPILYHYGTDPAMTTIDIPVNQFAINGDTKTIYLKFDLGKLYSAVDTVDFRNNNNIHESTNFYDIRWLGIMQTNFPKAFTFDKVK